MVKLLADECVYKETIDFLKKEKIDIKIVKKKGLESSLDKKILDFCNKNDYVFLTRDKDFGNIINFPPRLFNGIILLKVFPEDVELVHNNLLEFLKTNPALKGKLAVVDSFKVRIHKGI